MLLSCWSVVPSFGFCLRRVVVVGCVSLCCFIFILFVVVGAHNHQRVRCWCSGCAKPQPLTHACTAVCDRKLINPPNRYLLLGCCCCASAPPFVANRPSFRRHTPRPSKQPNTAAACHSAQALFSLSAHHFPFHAMCHLPSAICPWPVRGVSLFPRHAVASVAVAARHASAALARRVCTWRAACRTRCCRQDVKRRACSADRGRTGARGDHVRDDPDPNPDPDAGLDPGLDPEREPAFVAAE